MGPCVCDKYDSDEVMRGKAEQRRTRITTIITRK